MLKVDIWLCPMENNPQVQTNLERKFPHEVFSETGSTITKKVEMSTASNINIFGRIMSTYRGVT